MSLRTLASIAGLALAVGLALSAVTPAARAGGLEDLPDYRPKPGLSGTLRTLGNSFEGLTQLWEADFSRYNPGVRFVQTDSNAGMSLSAMILGVADIGVSGREPVLTEYLSFDGKFKYDPTQISVATGSYDLKGMTWAEVLFVNRENPLTRLTMKQVDGIFGSERSGGYIGFRWMPQFARGPEDNIRTWGELGLTGDWADKAIQTYGYAFTGMANFFQLKVLKGSDKWNPNYREYVEFETRMISKGDVGQTGDIKRMLRDELAKNKYGIAWTGIAHVADVKDLVKPIALAAEEGSPYVAPTRETVADWSYPMTRSIFMFVKHPPNQPVEPNVKEFITYVLSRQGQDVVAKHKIFLPLPARVAEEQLKKLD